jgi:hypothetical protein
MDKSGSVDEDLVWLKIVAGSELNKSLHRGNGFFSKESFRVCFHGLLVVQWME